MKENEKYLKILSYHNKSFLVTILFIDKYYLNETHLSNQD